MNTGHISNRIVLERFLNRMEAYALYCFLDSRGIPVSVSDAPLSLAMGEIPFVEITTALMLEDSEMLEEAQSLMQQFRSGLPGVRGAAWICPTCEESHEPMFGACWNCGEPRP